MQRISLSFSYSIFLAILLLTGLGGLSLTHAEELLPGVHYDLIKPPVIRFGSKPEIVEVFNFKCPHCFAVSPKITLWVEKNRERVAYRALPVYWGKQTDLPLRAFFAAEFLGKGEAMKKAIFHAHFKGSADIEHLEEVIFLAEAAGLDPDQFRDHVSSFGVSTKIVQAKGLQSALGISSTPTIVINGKYRVSPGRHAKGTNGEADYDRLFQIIEALMVQ